MSTLTVAKCTTSTKFDFTLHTSVAWLRAFTMCSTFEPNCRLEKTKNNFIGILLCPNRVCSKELCVHNYTFQHLIGIFHQFLQCESTCQSVILPLNTKSLFFLMCNQRNYFSKELRKSIQDLIGVM